MGLSQDQKALLRLLAQREQGYEDIAALMGLSVEEVRARVKDALDAVERDEAATPPAGETTRLAAESPPEVPSPSPPVERAAEQLPPSPGPEPVEATPGTGPRPTPPAAAIKRSTPKAGSRRPLPRQRRLYAIAAGLAAVVLVIVLLATGAFDGGDSDAGSSAASSSQADDGSTRMPTRSQLSNPKLTGAKLEPVDGSDASGAALFGRQKNRVLMQVEATGLEPSPRGSSYTVWFYKSPQLALRVGAIKVDESGGIRAQLPIPTQLLAYVASGVFDKVDVSLSSDAAYRAAVAKARKAKRLPAYSGESVLRGKISGPLLQTRQQQR